MCVHKRKWVYLLLLGTCDLIQHNSPMGKVYTFPVAATTHYHELTNLKGLECFTSILQFCRLAAWSEYHWAKTQVLAGLVPSTGFREDLFLALSSF